MIKIREISSIALLLTILVSTFALGAQARSRDFQGNDPAEVDQPPVIEHPVKTQTKKAMTWGVLDAKTASDGTPYFLFGSDSQTNPYDGDTSTSETLNLLCIKKENLAKPSVLPNTTTTPNGAVRGSWSGGKALVVFDVAGTSLTSKAAADNLCNYTGESTLGISGFQMAEFHDGNKSEGWVGWDFWADGSKVVLNPSGQSLTNRRFWVYINDQPANPWP
jgi:hypothetical protein